MSDHESKVAAVKVATSVGGAGMSKWLSAIGIYSWSDFSGALASVVSVLFIIDWIWKRIKASKEKSCAV